MSSPTSQGPVATAVTFAVTLALVGCSFIPSPPEASHGGGEVAADLEAFYEQSISWTQCGKRLQCATVRAPLDWADAGSSDAIDLAIVRHRAAGGRLGSLLVNPGGPGISGFDYVHQGARYVFTEAVLDAYDVVGFDPRGVGRSSAVTCLDDAEKDELLYGTFEDAYGTSGWIEELADRQAAFAEACAANTGELLGHVDTASVARDLDMLRVILGDKRLNYLGYSYGTEIGATYAELFPDRVGRLVLDGAVDPLLGYSEMVRAQATGFEGAARAYMADCVRQQKCPFTGPVDAGLAELRQMLDEVDSLALQSDDGRVLDMATVGTALAYTLYSPSSWPELSAIVNGIRARNADAAFRNADAYNQRAPDGDYASNGLEAYIAISCLDGSFADDPASTLERLAEIGAAAPTLGRAIALDDFAVLDTTCSAWPEPRREAPMEFDADGAAPILVVGTTNDPATPYAWAQSLARQLSSAVLVTNEGEGHTIYAQGEPCIDDTVDAYLLTGQAPQSDPQC